MVPSLTETLLQPEIEKTLEVVGRTRFCIHPEALVKSIPIVGGTKNIDWDLVRNLNADLIVLDKEENPLFMAEDSPIPWVATHFAGIESAAGQMEVLAKACNSMALLDFAKRYEAAVKKLYVIEPEALLQNSTWVLKELEPLSQGPWLYVIWKKPWMAVGEDTFIGSQLKKIGFEMSKLDSEKKYPEISEELIRQSNLMLSSEPYPFHKEDHSNFSGAVVDGESLSWFGIRNLKF